MWVVSTHDDRGGSARGGDARSSLRHRLPTLPFVARATLGSTNGALSRDQALARSNLRRGSTPTAAGCALLAAEGLELRPSALQRRHDDRGSARPAPTDRVAVRRPHGAPAPASRSRSSGPTTKAARALEATRALGPPGLRRARPGGGRDAPSRTSAVLVETRRGHRGRDRRLRPLHGAPRGHARSAPARIANALPFMPAVGRPRRAWSMFDGRREATTSSSGRARSSSSAPSTTWTSNTRTTSSRMGSSPTTRSTRSAARTSATSSTSSATSPARA